MPPARATRLTLACVLALAVALLVVVTVKSNGASPARPVADPTVSAAPSSTPGTRSLLHVAVDGRDDAAGTPAAPLRSIAEAVSKSTPGGTVVIHAGSYHEQLKIENRPGLRIQAAPGDEVWLDGSLPVDTWGRDGNLWVSSGWRAEFDSSPTYSWGEPDNTTPGWSFLDPKHPMAAHPDQVWIDDVAQDQVASRSEVGEGTFFVDYDRDELVLGSDPDGHEVRASALTQALRVRSARTVFTGIGIRRYAPSVPHMGAVTIEASRVTFDKMSIVDNATTGLHVLSSGVTLRRLEVARNGMMGLTATEANGLRLDRVVARDNNVERFNSSPAAGGIKIGRTRGVTVERSVFEDNAGNGLWFDESVYDIGLFHSRSIRNTGHGVSIEISGKADVAGNVVAHNRGNGIKINNSDDVQLWNNTFVANNRPINVVQDDRDQNPRGSYHDYSLPLTWQIRNISIRNNVVSGSSGDCLICVEDYTDRWSAAQLNVTALGNVYGRPDASSPKWAFVWASELADPYVFRNLEDFRKTCQQENPGRLITGRDLVDDDFNPSSDVTRLVDSVAQPTPAPLSARIGVPTDTRHLGAWIS